MLYYTHSTTVLKCHTEADNFSVLVYEFQDFFPCMVILHLKRYKEVNDF